MTSRTWWFKKERKKERIYFSKVIIKHQNRHSIKINNSERIDKRHIERPLIVYPVYINNSGSGYLNKIMIKIKYILNFLIFSLKRRYFGYKKTIVLGGSPSIEALSPLLEDINNCGKKLDSPSVWNAPGLVPLWRFQETAHIVKNFLLQSRFECHRLQRSLQSRSPELTPVGRSRHVDFSTT